MSYPTISFWDQMCDKDRARIEREQGGNAVYQIEYYDLCDRCQIKFKSEIAPEMRVAFNAHQ